MATASEIRTAMASSEGNMTEAASSLGMSRNGLYAAAKRLNVNPDAFRPADRATCAFVLRADECIDELPEVEAEYIDPEIEAAIAVLG